MSFREFGAVCDVSVLSNRESFERTRRILNGGSLYLPSATYSWLARDRLISVRGEAIGYSLVSQFVRDRKLLVVYLPELLDELSRRLLFSSRREVPLTDLRAFMLASHLNLPLFTFAEEPVKRLQEHFGARTLWELDIRGNWLSLRDEISRYRELASDVGDYLDQRMGDEGAFDGLVKNIGGLCRGIPNGAAAKVEGREPAKDNPGRLKIEFVAWDLLSILREYLNQHVLQPEIVRNLCERALLMVASTSER